MTVTLLLKPILPCPLPFLSTAAATLDLLRPPSRTGDRPAVEPPPRPMTRSPHLHYTGAVDIRTVLCSGRMCSLVVVAIELVAPCRIRGLRSADRNCTCAACVAVAATGPRCRRETPTVTVADAGGQLRRWRDCLVWLTCVSMSLVDSLACFAAVVACGAGAAAVCCCCAARQWCALACAAV